MWTCPPADAASFLNFPYGECTYWAASQRPDLVGAVWGNAWQWPYEASRAGYVIGYTPRPGAIAAWQPWVAGADGYGHVAYVLRVGYNGWFEVSQENWPWPGVVTYMWVHQQPGISFIYGGS